MKINKVAIYYPPFRKGKKFPLISQNRQFKFTNSDQIKIFPVVMATLATMLKEDGREVLFLDSVTNREDFDVSYEKLIDFKPDMIIMETKAPIIKDLLALSQKIKMNLETKIIFCGDHASLYTEEVAKNEGVDFVASTGYYDFIIRDLAVTIDREEAPPKGISYLENGIFKTTGAPEEYDLDSAPFIDRDLTRSSLYGEAYLYKPTAYILTGRGCGGPAAPDDKLVSSFPGRCTFCIWQHALWGGKAKLRSPENVASEIELLVFKYGIKEIFDDNESGGVWSTWWLENFYEELKKRDLIGAFSISTNGRADELTGERVALLKKIGYRLIKIGLESANDATLKKLGKDETFEQIKEGVKRAKDAGLVTLLTTMVGYPWEDEKDTAHTYCETKKLMLYKTHFGDSLQSSIIVPYPGSPLYNYAVKKDYLTEEGKDYQNYDMEHRILKTNIDAEKWVKKMWSIHLHPSFLLRSFFSLRKKEDILLAWRGVLSLFGHLKDYK